MFNMKPELLAGESVLGEYGATVYQVRGSLSSAGSNIRLFLTDRRLILKAGLGPQRPLSIHAIRDIREEKIGFHTMARLEFADGHLEWFTVQDQALFLQALKAARVGAPVIAEVVTPAPIGKPATGKVVLIILGIALLVVLCIVILGVLLGGLVFFL